MGSNGASRTWASPRYKQTKRQQIEDAARRKICEHSPFWYQGMDLDQHRREWAAEQARHEHQKQEHAEKLATEMYRTDWEPRPMRKAFDGKQFATNHGVLGYETIWTPSWEEGKANIAPWPTRSEMKYEGEDRISTDRLHRRFPGAPREENNDTVNWQLRPIIQQFPFDDFYFPIPQPVDVFMRTHWVDELEFTNTLGEVYLGRDLMNLLDPQEVNLGVPGERQDPVPQVNKSTHDPAPDVRAPKVPGKGSEAAPQQFRTSKLRYTNDDLQDSGTDVPTPHGSRKGNEPAPQRFGSWRSR